MSRVTSDAGSAIVRVLAAIALVATGAGGTWLLMRPGSAASPAPATGDGTRAASAAPSAEAAAARPATLSLGAAARSRAGITVAEVTTGEIGATLRLPAIVRPDAYREVVVSPLVGGRVASVTGVLGQPVDVGTPLATLVSTELAEAQNRYLTHRAQLEADHARLMRVEKLVEIGAASRQELDDARAVHETHETELQSSRSMLRVLGMSNEEIGRLATAEDVRAAVTVRSPAAGIITKRETNAGQTVGTETAMFVVSRLDRVWVVASAFEADLARVQVGQPARVTSEAAAGLRLDGRVAYVDPAIDPATRTGSLRVEVPNPRQALRFGMYAHVELAGQPRSVPVVPATAVQTVGSRAVVYVERHGDAGTFEERPVRTGATVGNLVEVREGLRPGERVVATGSFYLRAELERTGGSVAAGPTSPTTPAAPGGHDHGAPGADGPLAVTLTVNAQGFTPSTIRAKPGQVLHLTFIRETEGGCGTELSIPALGITRPLPLKQPVHLQIDAPQSGELTFSCGMNMLKGSVVVSP